MSARIAIAGGGIIGLTAALELREKGHAVTVVDKGPFGAEASTAAGGMLAPQLESSGPGAPLELGLRSRGLWPALAQKVAAASGRDVDYRTAGILRCAFDEGDLHHLASEEGWQRASSLRCELLDGDAARRLEPLLSKEVVGALHLPDDHSIDPSLFMPALVEAVKKAGVELRTGEVKALALRGGAAAGLELSDGRLEADWVVNALGAWATRVEGFGLPADTVRPIRGQIVELAAERQPGITCGSRYGYSLPRKNGRVIAGSTKEDVGFAKANTAGGTRQILDGVLKVMPHLAEAPVRSSWSGLRPLSRDELPLIGPGQLDRLIWATGHYRNGILLAPVTARLIAQLVQGQALPVWAAPANPARFARPVA